jgi:hypothetical protein
MVEGQRRGPEKEQSLPLFREVSHIFRGRLQVEVSGRCARWGRLQQID